MSASADDGAAHTAHLRCRAQFWHIQVSSQCHKSKTALDQFLFAGQSGAQRATIAKLTAEALRPCRRPPTMVLCTQRRQSRPITYCFHFLRSIKERLFFANLNYTIWCFSPSVACGDSSLNEGAIVPLTEGDVSVADRGRAPGVPPESILFLHSFYNFYHFYNIQIFFISN